ncbi:antitoxin [Jiella sp. M17.18]|uniref:AbrB/MazE/SpoVT family DNA-binding domain-containing protein n=1 Tax=Jiella sp. M17.18 TaxID=3234247 RepID=UPI0034DF3B35
MALARLRKVGGSVMVAIPPSMLEAARLQPSSPVDVSIDEATGVLTVRPARPRYTLAELVAQCDPDAPLTEEDRAWLDDAPAGDEAL